MSHDGLHIADGSGRSKSDAPPLGTRWSRVPRLQLPFSLLVAALLLRAAHGAQEPAAERAQRPAARKSGPTKTSAGPQKAVLVRVNGHPITEGELQFQFVSSQIPEELRAAARKATLEMLVDRQLIREFLADRRADASQTQVELQVQRVRQFVSARGENPDEFFAKLGYDDAALRRDLALPLSWLNHVRRTVTQEKLREVFAAERSKFDGTEVRASQILLKLAGDAKPADEQAAMVQLSQIRGDILAGKMTFSEAAAKHSQAPSRQQGGDVGFFPFQGKMPESISRVAFDLKKDDVSEPFRTTFGVHLLTVTDIKPGQLSLEDVRSAVMEVVSNQLWKDTVRDLRGKAKIEWTQ